MGKMCFKDRSWCELLWKRQHRAVHTTLSSALKQLQRYKYIVIEDYSCYAHLCEAVGQQHGGEGLLCFYLFNTTPAFLWGHLEDVYISKIYTIGLLIRRGTALMQRRVVARAACCRPASHLSHRRPRRSVICMKPYRHNYATFMSVIAAWLHCNDRAWAARGASGQCVMYPPEHTTQWRAQSALAAQTP